MVCRFPISLDVRTLVVEPRSYPRPSPDFSQTRGSGAHDHGIVPYLDQSRLKLLLDDSSRGKRQKPPYVLRHLRDRIGNCSRCSKYATTERPSTSMSQVNGVTSSQDIVAEVKASIISIPHVERTPSQLKINRNKATF